MDRGAQRAAVHGVTESDTNKYMYGTHAHAGSVAQWHVESSQTRNQTRSPCLGRQVSNY